MLTLGARARPRSSLLYPGISQITSDWREYLRRLAPPRVSDVWRAFQAGRQLLSTKDVKCFWHK